ncbi:MAG: hypothetical protein HGA86_02040 [Anaerolineaceae bacterium]|nr:hypothetical protein [Anaerolineaceae bacterium]
MIHVNPTSLGFKYTRSPRTGVSYIGVEWINGDGNDGTTMPWNDTAQLNYLNPEVREVVIQTILEVARRFPIIRFDAAMTLAKKHFQRLWFPEPGTGGAIPSRSDYAMTRTQFDAIMPVEFWREVVDRCAKEAPDTLLLAEAFWLMESYFVRTLGMHRVYNSAFMNMLRNEDNAGYRLIMKNTLEFDPEILKRFVNFMNNPDERTAVDQFGKGDKYFGICTLMATLPGLPMFGHGQVEGFSEKYGMEFRRAYLEEHVDPYLVERHERETFPLLHKRQIFANVDLFRMYDFYADNGSVHEDVFAYSNSDGREHALVVFNNRFSDVDGWINQSCTQAVRIGGEKQAQRSKLADNLHIAGGPNNFCIARDSISGLEYIRPSSEIQQKGLHLSLHAYQYFVFVEFREITDDAHGSYRQLFEYLNGRGVPSVQDALRELVLQPVQAPFRQIANAGYMRYLLDHRLTEEQPEISSALLDEAGQKIANFLAGIRSIDPSVKHLDSVQNEMLSRLQTVLSLETINQLPGYSRISKLEKVLTYLQTGMEKYPDAWITLFHYVFTHNLGKLHTEMNAKDLTLTWIEEWQLGKIIQEAGQSMGLDNNQSWQSLVTLRLLVNQQDWFEEFGDKPTAQILSAWLADPDIQSFLGVNRYQDILWFNHESYLKFIWWMTTLAIVQVEGDAALSASIKAEKFLLIHETALELLEAEKTSGFQITKLLENAEK